MRILFDHGTPAPLRRALLGHSVVTAAEMRWNELDNGRLLAAAEIEFDAVITTDQSIGYQQNLAGRRLSILVLPTTNWRLLEMNQERILAAINVLRPGEIIELKF